MTNMLVEFVLNRLTDERSFTSVAREVNLSVSTIINVYYYNMFGCGSRATSPASFHLVPKL